MQGIQQRGLQVPDDIAVMGFDDIPVASYTTPPLSTIQQDTSLAGEMLVENLLRLVNNQPIETNQIEPKIVIRTSCGTTSKG